MRPAMMYMPVMPDQYDAALKRLGFETTRRILVRAHSLSLKNRIQNFLESNPSYSREELLAAINLTEQQLKDMS